MLLTQRFRAVEQNVVVVLEMKPTITTTQCLTIENEAIQQYTDLPSSNIIRVYFIDGENLVFDTLLVSRDTEYQLHFLPNRQALGDHIMIKGIEGKTPWFKFFLYSILLETKIDEITRSL